MSIAFRKKDYQYDGDDLEYDDAAEGDGEDDQNHLDGRGFHHNAYTVPSEHIFVLYEELQNIARDNAVEIFDELTPLKLAEFVSLYAENAFV